MSTRANIGIKLDNGQYKMIYCHYDGYPEHVGKVLCGYHDSFENVQNLIESYAIRSFDENGSVDFFDDGEAEYYNSIDDALDGFDYAYVFIEKWRCYTKHMYGHIEEVQLY